ncbi:hypothetical protein [Streptomyces sp. NPDC002132]|uniref:hypothetical protein n=1 Tax=unclassified Streptomyces TaxID=2593676 RepID=UPI003325AC22
MAEDALDKKRAAGKASIKGFLICLTVLSVVGAAAWFGLTTGLDRLPSRVCDNAVDRDVVIRTLPRTRTAEEGAEKRHEGKDLMFSCRIYTSSDSILSGMAQVQDASVQQWFNHYGANRGGTVVRVSTDGIEALARLDRNGGNSYIYIPCVPRGVRAEDAKQSYAIITQASVIGEGRVTGAALRQAVTDFAYQVTEHAYKLADCQGSRAFPEDLPRYAEK